MLSVDLLQGLQIATDCRPGALCPRIRALRWPAPDAFLRRLDENTSDLASSFISLFIGNDLSDLSISSETAHLPPLFKTALFASANRQLGIKGLTLHMRFEATPGDSDFFVHRFLSSHDWNDLNYLSTTSIPAHSIRALANLPQLSTLYLTSQGPLSLAYQPGGTPILPIEGSFRSLQKLVMCPSEVSSAVAFLQHLPPKNRLEDLHILRISSDSPSFTEVQGLVTTIITHCNPAAMKDIRLALSSLSVREDAILDIDINQAIDISCRFKFTKLEGITIESPFYIPFTETHMSRTTVALPSLQCLVLTGARSFHRPPPPIDITHILRLTQGLRKLHRLGLSFDATGIQGHEMAEGGPQYQLGLLDIDVSPILSPSQVAHCLKANFPNVSHITHRFYRPDESSVFADRWRAVSARIGPQPISYIPS
jgi:hypothetical protein